MEWGSGGEHLADCSNTQTHTQGSYSCLHKVPASFLIIKLLEGHKTGVSTMRHSGQNRPKEGSDLALLDGWYIITPIFWSNELLNMLAASGNLKHF